MNEGQRIVCEEAPFRGLAELEVTDAVVRAACEHPAGEVPGRVPLAMLTFGEVTGLGWGFLHPWQQLALFPEKGTLAGIGHRHRHHERFFLRALVPVIGWRRHPRMAWEVEGRYWEGIAWRASWGRRMRIVLLEPDLVTATTHPEGSYADWLGTA